MTKISGKASRRIAKDKDKISKIAKWLLVALCVQFLIYLVLLNIIPFSYDANGDGTITYQEVNGFYKEIWYRTKGAAPSNEIDNGMQFIHTYNNIFLVIELGICVYYMIVIMEEYEGKLNARIKQFFVENKGLFFLLLFMTWTFISSLCAYDKFRSFIGCYNLRDGFVSFMFYGSVLTCILLLGKNNEKDKKLITNLFLITATVIAVITLIDYYAVAAGKSIVGSLPIVKRYGTSTFSILAGIFNNSNHYGYYLSIAVIAAAAMFIKTKIPIQSEDNKAYMISILKSVLYVVSFILMTYVLIINDTFGSYLGVLFGIIFMIIVSLINKKDIIPTIIIGVIFVAMSLTVQNAEGVYVAKANFENTGKDVLKIIGVEVTENEEETEKESNISAQDTTSELSDDVADAGSGRYALWINTAKIVLGSSDETVAGKVKTFMLGKGLENLIYVLKNADGNSEGRSHSLIFQLAGTVGVPGMILYFLGIGWIFISNLKNIKNWNTFTYTGMAVIVSYIISSTMGNSGFYTSGYFYIFVGFVVVGMMELKDDKNINQSIKSTKTK